MTIQATQLSLYYSPYCPYCQRVLNALVEMGLNVDIKAGNASGMTLENTFFNRAAKKALKTGGGRTTVPCLRIERDGKTEWMYESLDIIAFLKQQLKRQ